MCIRDRFVASDYYSGTTAITSSMTVRNFTQNGGTFILNNITNSATGSSTGILNVKGNFNQTSGTFTTQTTVSTSTTNPGAQVGNLVFNGSALQTFGLLGSVTNAVNLTINNSNGVTLNSALSLPNSATLTLTNGLLTTTSTNLLTITNTATSAIVGGSSTSYINGPLQRRFPQNLTVGSIYVFPIGKGGNYNPAELIDATTTSSSNLAEIKAEVIASNAGGSGNNGIYVLNTNQYWTITTAVNSGSFSNTKLRLTDASYGTANIIVTGSTPSSTNYTTLGGTNINSPVNTITSNSSFALNNANYALATVWTPGVSYTWTGAVNTNWSIANNWQDSIVPPPGSDILIGTGLSNYPSLSGTTVVGNCSLQTGATLNLNSDTLVINDTISGLGSFVGSPQSNLIMTGKGTVYFSQSNQGTSNALKSLTINTPDTILLGNIVMVNNMVKSIAGVLASNGNLTLVSNSTGTAMIPSIGGIITGNVTSQRYIPAKTARRYSFLGSPVTVSIRNSWQQQVYITGTGSGGTICGTTTGDGGNTDKYNSNGFDKTYTNSPSMFNYNATGVNGNRWVSVANTDYTNLSPGTGYKVNIRGNRNSGTVSCANQLNSASPAAPEAVTLSATGVLTTGNLSVSLNDTGSHKFTLLANPYQSPISYTAFQLSNSSKINNKMWTYSPYSNGNYTTFSQGVVVNGATGYDNVCGDYLAVGQAFFVEAKANGSVSFQESHKTNGVIPNTQYFGTVINPMIRVGWKTNDSVLLDEIVVRFDKSGTRNYNQTNDAISFNAGNRVLTSLKDGYSLAITTHPVGLLQDTTYLGITSKGNGSFKLQFSDFEGIDVVKSITLMDNFLGISQNIRENPVYGFNISADSNSQGNNRFKVLVGNGTALSLDKISLSVTKNEEGVGVRWSVANQTGIHSYIVERGYDNLHFAGIATLIAKADNNYTYEDNSITDTSTTTYYRNKAVSETGVINFSNVAKLITNFELGISLYPNPLKDRVLNVSFSNIAAGKYEISIYNSLGEKVNEQLFSHIGGTSSHVLTIGNLLASGIYNVVISNKGSGLVVCRKRLVVSYE